MDGQSGTEALSSSLAGKTGKDLSAWIEIAKSSSIFTHKALIEHLKAAYGLGHGHANAVALKTFATDAASIGDDALLADMFAGARSGLRPIYDRILEKVCGFGSDVERAPKKGYVSLRRSKQFAIVQPSTKDRLDIGLNLKGVEPAGRLEASASFNAMVTHRVRIVDASQVDDDLVGLLRAAYDRA